MTEFPSDEPATHPTGFPVESEPGARPDPETEPGGGEPDFDSEPDRTATPDSTYTRTNPADDLSDSGPTLPTTPQYEASDEASDEMLAETADEADGANETGVTDEVVSDGAFERDGVGVVTDEAGGADEASGADDLVTDGGADEWAEGDARVGDGGAEEGAPEGLAEVGGRGSGDEGERGHPLVEETMERLEDLRDRPVSEHAEVYADLHDRLQSALAEAERPDPHERV